MRTWVSCEEKLALLERMYQYSHQNLGKKDEAVYRALRQELAHRAESVKALTEKPEYARADEPRRPVRVAKSAAEEQRAPDLSEVEPEEVVKVFVSCWDDQDFETEFALLSPTFRHAEGTPGEIEEYVKHRKAKYSARLLTGQIGKQFESIVRNQVAGSWAIVDCIETRKWHTSTASQRRRYHLRKYPDGWKIEYFENLVS